MEETLDLRKILKVLKKRALLIMILGGCSLLAAALVSHFSLNPVYESSSQILVNQKSDGGGGSLAQNVEADLNLVNTYSVIIKSPVILEKVIKRMNLNTTVNELDKKITVKSASDSKVIEVSIRSESQQEATDIANTVSSIFKEEIQEVMEVNNVVILSPAVVKEGQLPVFPNFFLNLIIALSVGILFGIGIAFLLDYFDTSVKDKKDVERLLDVPLLAIISITDEIEKPNEQSITSFKEKEA